MGIKFKNYCTLQLHTDNHIPMNGQKERCTQTQICKYLHTLAYKATRAHGHCPEKHAKYCCKRALSKAKPSSTIFCPLPFGGELRVPQTSQRERQQHRHTKVGRTLPAPPTLLTPFGLALNGTGRGVAIT